MRLQEPTRSREPLALDLPNDSAGQTLAHGLNLPLAALRASVEALSDELSPRDVGQTLIRGVLEEVERLDRNLQDLLDFSRAPKSQPLDCSLDEIFFSARGALPTRQRARLVYGRPARRSLFEVDGTILSTALRRLIENALESSDENVLVLARQTRVATSFTVLGAARSPIDLDWASIPFHTTKPNQLGLGLPLVQRDLATIGGRLEVRPSGPGKTCVRITLPANGSRAAGGSGA